MIYLGFYKIEELEFFVINWCGNICLCVVYEVMKLWGSFIFLVVVLWLIFYILFLWVVFWRYDFNDNGVKCLWSSFFGRVIFLFLECVKGCFELWIVFVVLY